MIFEEEIPEKSQIEREHLERVKVQMSTEEEALKTSRIIKGADTKNYKKFKDVQYVPPPKQELSDEMKLKLTRRYQALNGFMGLVGLGMTFFIIYNPTLYLSIFKNFVIVLSLHDSTLYLSIFEIYFVIEMNLILLGCALVSANIVGIIGFQHKHDKISDRISAGRRTRIRAKKIMRRYHGLTMLMGVVGVGIIFLGIYYSTHHIPIFEKFVIVLSIYNSTLYLSIFESFVIKMNLILLGCVLAATSIGIIVFRYKHSKISNRMKLTA
jgi:hypothetical protein